MQFKEATGRDYGAFWATLNISKQTKVGCPFLYIAPHPTKSPIIALPPPSLSAIQLPLSVAVRTFRRKAVEFEAHDWVREVFSMADRNNDGNLSHTELKKLFKAEPELRETFRNIAGRAWSDFWVEIDENNVRAGRDRSIYKVSTYHSTPPCLTMPLVPPSFPGRKDIAG